LADRYKMQINRWLTQGARCRPALPEAEHLGASSGAGIVSACAASALLVAEYPRLRLMAVCLVPARGCAAIGFDTHHCVAAAGTFASGVGISAATCLFLRQHFRMKFGDLLISLEQRISPSSKGLNSKFTLLKNSRFQRV